MRVYESLTVRIGFAAVLLTAHPPSAMADTVAAWVNQHFPQGVVGATKKVQCDQLRQQWSALRQSVSREHDQCTASPECKRTSGKSRQCQCAACEEVHTVLFDQPAFWKQAESQVNACLASVKDYENRQRQEQREQKDAAFRDQQRQHVERMQQDQALRDQQRRLREKTDEQAQLTRQQAERDLAFENYERRLNGLPERERKKTATEELYLRGKEGKDLKDAVDEVYEAYTDTATMTMRGVGKAVGAGILDGLSPGLPPYPEAGSAYVDEDPERAKAVDEKVRKQRRASDRWLKEMERKEKEQNPYYPLPWPPPNDGPEIKAAP